MHHLSLRDRSSFKKATTTDNQGFGAFLEPFPECIATKPEAFVLICPCGRRMGQPLSCFPRVAKHAGEALKKKNPSTLEMRISSL